MIQKDPTGDDSVQVAHGRPPYLVLCYNSKPLFHIKNFFTVKVTILPFLFFLWKTTRNISIYLSINLNIYISSIYLSLYVRVVQLYIHYPSIYLSSIYLSICIGTRGTAIYLYIYLSVYKCIYLSICAGTRGIAIYLSIYISIYLSIYLCRYEGYSYLSIYQYIISTYVS